MSTSTYMNYAESFWRLFRIKMSTWGCQQNGLISRRPVFSSKASMSFQCFPAAGSRWWVVDKVLKQRYKSRQPHATLVRIQRQSPWITHIFFGTGLVALPSMEQTFYASLFGAACQTTFYVESFHLFRCFMLLVLLGNYAITMRSDDQVRRVLEHLHIPHCHRI